MTALIIFLIAIAGAVGVAVAGYYSIQSLIQAHALYHPLPLSELKHNVEKVVAIHGEPELMSDGKNRLFKFPVLWYRKKEQEWRSHGRHGHWATIRTREQAFDFHLNFPKGGRILLFSKPTEVQGASSKVMKRGFFSRSRSVLEWMPVRRTMTVMGRLILSKNGATIVPDKSAGMIFSVYPPKKAALVEFLKGSAGILGGMAVTGLVIYIFLMAMG